MSPFPWTQLYLTEIDGKPLGNYYHWLALTYVVTLATNPAITLPCGVDHKGMPFGLQVVGRFRGDARLLACAGALERAFAAQPALARPRPEMRPPLRRRQHPAARRPSDRTARVSARACRTVFQTFPVGAS